MLAERLSEVLFDLLDLVGLHEEIRIVLVHLVCGRHQRRVVLAPKLRAKGSDAAVTLFLCEEAVAPSTMLSPMIQGTAIAMTDRAARRLCDRLVELGVVRELTWRATFRLYGIAP